MPKIPSRSPLRAVFVARDPILIRRFPKMWITWRIPWYSSLCARSSKIHNFFNFYRIASVPEAWVHKFRRLQCCFRSQVRIVLRKFWFMVFSVNCAWKYAENSAQSETDTVRAKLGKFITCSIFIRLRPFFLRCFRNSVTDNFTEDSESGFCTKPGVIFTWAEILPINLIFNHTTNQIYKPLITLIVLVS